MAGLMRAPRSGSVLKITGVALVVASFIWVSACQVMFGIDIGQALPVFVWFLIPVGALVYWRGRQYEAQARAQDIIASSKAHVLYLRPFAADHSATFWGTILGHASAVRGIWKTEEEHLADALRPFGDLIAVGRPNELPIPGASRIYSSDEEWQDVVINQMQAAQLVVIRASSGDNVFWELTQAVKILNPRRLLIFLKVWDDDYESFRTRANSVLPVSLPEISLRRLARGDGFIGFADDWKPSFFRLRGAH